MKKNGKKKMTNYNASRKNQTMKINKLNDYN